MLDLFTLFYSVEVCVNLPKCMWNGCLVQHYEPKCSSTNLKMLYYNPKRKFSFQYNLCKTGSGSNEQARHIHLVSRLVFNQKIFFDMVWNIRHTSLSLYVFTVGSGFESMWYFYQWLVSCRVTLTPCVLLHIPSYHLKDLHVTFNLWRHIVMWAEVPMALQDADCIFTLLIWRGAVGLKDCVYSN